MNKKSVYIETSVVSYLTARPSENLIAAAWQKATIDWWEKRRNRFDLFISRVVLEEASRGNPEAAQRRIESLAGISSLAVTEDVIVLAKDLIQKRELAQNATPENDKQAQKSAPPSKSA